MGFFAIDTEKMVAEMRDLGVKEDQIRAIERLAKRASERHGADLVVREDLQAEADRIMSRLELIATQSLKQTEQTRIRIVTWVAVCHLTTFLIAGLCAGVMM